MVFSEYNGDCVSRVKMEDRSKEFVFHNREDDLGIYDIRDIAEERTGKAISKSRRDFYLGQSKRLLCITMTRMWIGVKPEELCDQHLLGEHKELHMEVGSLKNHPHGQAIVEGHVKKGQVVLSQIAQRHNLLVDEMIMRGMNHNSPLDTENLRENELYEVDNNDIEYNRKDLNERCEDCID